MSRQVDLTKPLSDDDRAYLLSRGQNAMVTRMDEQFAEPEPASAPEQEQEQEQSDGLENMTVDELKDLLRTRNLPVGGTKDELVSRLREAD
ncbi:MAG: SAP domain-containing protein [Candidatus Moraniibacteriota bacterium]